MLGERTLDVSRKYGISPARISQLRRDFHADWLRFTADPSDADLPFLVWMIALARSLSSNPKRHPCPFPVPGSNAPAVR